MSKLREEWDLTEESHLSNMRQSIQFVKRCRQLAAVSLGAFLLTGGLWLFLSWR